MLCQECESRNICQSPCPELELHLKEIEVPQRELTIGQPHYSRKFEWTSNVHLTKTEKEIVTLLGRGLSRDDVCKVLNITRGNLRIVLSRLKKKSAEL
jgi:DNA-binding NarL/FixJ family response regulator